MVNYPYLIGSFIVPALVAGLVSFLAVGWVYVNRMKPVMEVADKAIKTGMSAMGSKSGQVRLEKSIEKAVAGDLMTAQVPELELLLGLLSPDTRELVQNNPEAVLAIAQRLGLLKLGGQQQQADDEVYDVG